MKRKHSSGSSKKGCQIISKFFKTLERQDVHDAARLKDNPPVYVSQVNPVLQKLTKLREILTKKGLSHKKTGIDDDNKEENMNNNRVSHPPTNCEDLGSSCSSQNTTSSDDNEDVRQPSNTEHSEGHDLHVDSKEDVVETDNSNDSNDIVSASSINSFDLNLPNEETFDDRIDSKLQGQTYSMDNKREVCSKSEQDSNIELDDSHCSNEETDNDLTNSSVMDNQDYSNNQVSDLQEDCKGLSKSNQIDKQSVERLLIDDDMLGYSSEGSLLDRNTEGNLADDEDDLLLSEDSGSPIKRHLSEVSDKLSKIVKYPENSIDHDISDDQNNVEHLQESDKLPIPVENSPGTVCDSQNWQGNYSKSDSDSDDEFLTPPSFLYENKLKFEKVLCTPEKLTTPSGASPLCSPVKPARDMKKEMGTRNYKFSLQKMVNKSKKKEVNNAKLSQMTADLDAGIQKGGVKTMTSVLSEDDTDTERDDGKDLSQCKFPKEVSKHLVRVSNFSEELVGEDIFPDLHNCTLEKEIPYLNIPHPSDDDKFVRHLISSKSSEVKEVMCGGWFMQYYLKRPCPAPLAEWVFKIMCTYPDVYLSNHCFKTLWALLRAGYQDHNGIPKGIRGISNWVPSIANIINILQHYGATVETLSPKGSNLADILPHNDTDTSMESDSKDSSKTCKPQLCLIFRQLVQLVSHAVHYGDYMENDLPILLVIMCRLSLDLRLQEVLFDLEICISEILNCFGIAQWEEQIKSLPSLLVLTSTNHTNLLHVMQVLPPSPRGTKLRQLTSGVLVKFFVKELTSGNEIIDIKERTEALQSLCKTNKFELNELSIIVEAIKPKTIPNCNNHLLHTIIFLIDLAVGAEEYPSSERIKLKMLVNKLNNLNGEIKDPRAKYLDRSKVKDMLVRTIHKITCLLDTIKPPKEIKLSDYFEVNSSDFNVQSLEESTIITNHDDDNASDNSSSPEGSRVASPMPLSNADNTSDKEENQEEMT